MKDEPLEQVNNFRVASERAAGAICSVGGRFIAWRRRVKKRTRKLDDMHDARVEAGSAGQLGPGGVQVEDSCGRLAAKQQRRRGSSRRQQCGQGLCSVKGQYQPMFSGERERESESQSAVRV